MRLRLLKLACLVLVLALAGGLIVFNFADDDLQSAFIQTSSVTPATGIDTGPQASTNPPGGQAGAQPTSDIQTQAGSGQGAAFAPIAPSANDMSPSAPGAAAVVPVPAPTEVAPSPTSAPTAVGTAAPAPAPAAEIAQAAPVATTTEPAPATIATTAVPPPSAAPAQAVAAPPAAAIAGPTPMAAADASSAAPSSGPAEKAAPTTEAAAAPAAGSPPDNIGSASSSESSYAAVVWPDGQPSQASGSETAAAPKPQAKTSAAAPMAPVTHHRAAKPRAAASAAPVQPAEKPAATVDQSDTARATSATAAPAPSPPPHDLVAQVAPPHASAKTPLAPAPMPPSRESDFAAHLAVGAQVLIEFPSLQSNASGSLAGSGSVTNSSARVIPGIIGSWTSAPLADLPLKPSFGGSLFIGAPASGDSVASATTSGGYTLKLGQTNDWPVIMPRFFMGVPVADGTRASFGTGVWVNNVKETATLANGSGSQSDERTGVMMRPFLSAAIEQHAPLLGFLPPESQRLKVSGGYIFGDSTFSASFCAAGQTCIRTQDQGSWFLGLSFQMGFPTGGAPAP